MAPEAISRTSSVVNVSKPSIGETLNIASIPGGSITFDFDPATATVVRSGNNLSFEVISVRLRGKKKVQNLSEM